MVGNGKFSLRPIISGQLDTLEDARTGRRRPSDFAVLYGLPTVSFVVFVAVDVDISRTAGHLIAGASLAAAFLFGVVIQQYSRATDWADSRPEPSERTSRYATRLEELSANAAYAAIMTTLATGVLVAYTIATGHAAQRWLGSLALALLVHVLLTLAMVLRRVFLLTQERLRAARTGAERAPH